MLILSVLAVLGVFVSGYLAVSSATSAYICGSSESCLTVLSSSYAEWFNIPVSIFGMAFFIAILFLLMRQFETNQDLQNIKKVIFLMSLPALLGSLYFIGVQVIDLQSYCWVCMVFHAIVISTSVYTGLSLKKEDSLVPTLKFQDVKVPYLGVLTFFGLPILLYILFSSSANISNNPVVARSSTFDSIRLAAIDKPVSSKLYELENQIYQLRLSSLEGVILEEEAKSKGLNLQSLIQQEVISKISITENDIAQFRAAYGARIPKEWTSDNIRQYIRNQRQQTSTAAYVKQVIKDRNVSILLEKPIQQAILVRSNPQGSLTMGNPNAPVKIVEFSDIQCGYCSRAHVLLKDFVKRFPDKLHVTYRHFPLNFHQYAKKAAIAVVCADKQDKAWPLLDKFFANQKTLSDESVQSYAKELAIDLTAFNTCLSSQEAAQNVNNDMFEAERLGISSTPTLIINGKLHRGLPQESVILEYINN